MLKAKYLRYACLLLFVGCTSFDKDVMDIWVVNHTMLSRNQEIIEIPGHKIVDYLRPASLATIRVMDENGKFLPSQITYDNNLLCMVDVAPDKQILLKLVDKPSLCQPVSPEDSSVRCFLSPTKILWENDRILFLSDKASNDLKGSGGYSVMVKDCPVARGRSWGGYQAALGEIGCGGSAILYGDSLLVPRGWTEYEVLNDGPLRVTIMYKQAPVSYNNQEYTEVRLVSLDKGSFLNRISLFYLNCDTYPTLVTGLTMNEKQFTVGSDTSRMIGCSRPLVGRMFPSDSLYMGCIFPYNTVTWGVMYGDTSKMSSRDPGVIYAFPNLMGDSLYTYYAGAAWSCAGITSLKGWKAYLTDQLEKISHPLELKYPQRALK